MNVGGVEEGKCMIKDRLCHKKVLIVLDDVDHLEQLQALAGSHDWFGEGSLIIITTRDEHLLNVHKVNVIHTISLLNHDEAMELFCKHATRGHRSIVDYEVLSEDLVSYAGGLPLALTVLACSLCDKDMNQWRSAIAKLKEIPETDIVRKIKVSFDGLKLVEKYLFLDITCFFRGVDKDYAVEMLDACGFHPIIGVEVLRQKALITISDGKFDIHDMVQELGHYIVRGEHPKNPEKHSRVWKKEDILKIFTMDETEELDMIEAIRLDHYSGIPSERFPPIVANMKNLRSLVWRGDLPSSFPPRELCCLILYDSLQKQLWEGCKCLSNLRIMELQDMDNLTTAPDFEGLPNLERLKIRQTLFLKEIHPSIGRLKRLGSLSIECCWGLKSFPPITLLKKLETLALGWCPKLFKLSKIQRNHHIGLHFFPRGIRKLDLRCCGVGDKDIDSVDWEFPYLQELNLAQNNFSRLSFSRLRLPQLRWLNVSCCKKLVKLSDLPLSIAVLKADDCRSLESFGDISNCKWLWKVSLWGKNKVVPLVGDILLHSMLQGNAIEDHFMNVTLPYQIPKRFVGRIVRGDTLTLHLPQDWYSDFCGFLICSFNTGMNRPRIDITIKQEPEYDEKMMENQYELRKEPEYDEKILENQYEFE